MVDLKEKFGRKFVEATKMLSDGLGRVRNLVIEKEPILEITASVKGGHGEYVTMVNEKEFFCDCMGSKSHKTICKHVIFLVLYTFYKGLIKSSDVEKLLGRW